MDEFDEIERLWRALGGTLQELAVAELWQVARQLGINGTDVPDLPVVVGRPASLSPGSPKGGVDKATVEQKMADTTAARIEAGNRKRAKKAE